MSSAKHSPKKSPKLSPKGSPKRLSVTLVNNYTEKSFILYGDTKDLVEKLKEAKIRGIFSFGLSVDGKKTPGLCFSKKLREKVVELLEENNVEYKVREECGEKLSPKSPSAKKSPQDKVKKNKQKKEEKSDDSDNSDSDTEVDFTELKVSIVEDYTDKSFIVYGETMPLKDIFKQQKGRFNKSLTVNGEKVAGWVFSKKNLDFIKCMLTSKKVNLTFVQQ